jgi:exopolysaccharide biosynthesis protein
MNRRIILLLFFGIILLQTTVWQLPGQTVSSYTESDSLTFVKADWDTRIMHLGGIILRQCAFIDSSLFNSNQYVSVLEVSSSFRFDIVADTTLVLTTDFAEFVEAYAAVNGSFFAWDAPWNSVNYLRIDGRELAPNKVRENGIRTFRQSGCVVISQKGKLSIRKIPDHVMAVSDHDQWERELKAEDVLSSGPILRIEGKDEPVLENAFNQVRHPRTALGVRRGGRVLMVVVDGRAEEAAGMTMDELQHIMRWLRSWDAINLDGGGSSTLCVRRNLRRPLQVVNHPSDNRKFDHQGERRVANAIVVK